MTAIRRWAPWLAGLSLLAISILLTWRNPFQPGPGLDPSWIMAADYAAAKGLAYGRDFIFTYGPYHELATRMFDPQTYPLVLFYDAFQVVAVFWLALRNRSLVSAAALALCFVFLQERSDSLTATALFAVFLIALDRRGLWGLLFVALAGPLLLSKLSFGLVLLPLALLADLERAIGRRLPWVTVTLIVSMAAAFAASGQSLAHFAGFLASTLQIILGYGSAMQIEGPVGELWAALALVAVVASFGGVLAFARHRAAPKDLRAVAAFLGLAWMLFTVFKIGFVRQDGHTALFDGAIPAVLAVAFSYFDRPEAQARRARLTFGVLFVLALIDGIWWQGFAQRPSADARVDFGGRVAQALAEVPKQLGVAAGWMTGETQAAARANHKNALLGLAHPFPPQVVGSVDIIPWETAEVIAAGLDYRPRPVVQSYSAYTADLQGRDLAFFRGPRAPDTLILRLEDIDGRLPSLAIGPSLPAIGERYDMVGNDPLGLVLHRRPQARQAAVRQGSVQKVGLDEWATAPRAPGQLVMARIKLHRSLLGRLVGFLFREPVPTITLKTVSGREAPYRFVPGMAETGVAISPLPSEWAMGAATLLDPRWAAFGEPVTGVKLLAKGAWAFSGAEIAFDTIAFEPGFGGELKGLPLLAGALTGSDAKHGATFNGDEIFAHAPTTLRALAAGGAHLKGVAGIRQQPAGTPPGNGVRFMIRSISPQGVYATLFETMVAANGAPAPFDVSVPPGVTLQLETQDLGNNSYDWSYWGKLELIP